MPPKRKAPKTKKRKGPEGDASITSAEVLDAIRCPVCREVALPPINQCRNGHVLCKDCLDQLKDRREPCPTCRVPLQHYSVIRCLALEHVASSLSVECPHDGCSAVCKYNEVSDHIRECPFKPFPRADRAGRVSVGPTAATSFERTTPAGHRRQNYGKELGRAGQRRRNYGTRS